MRLGELMRRNYLLGAAAAALLSSCSSSESGGAAPAPAPTVAAPTPTPTTPAPTPSPTAGTYPAFASLTGAQLYSSGCLSFQGSNGGAPTLQEGGFYAIESGAVSYDGAGTYTVRGIAFGEADKLSGSQGGTLAYAKSDPANGGAMTRFDLVQPTPGTYSRTASVLVDGQARGRYCVLGVPTRNTDLPSATMVAFTTFSVRGRAFDKRSGTLVEYDLAPSSATLAANLATGGFTSRLTLVGNAGGSNVTLGSYDIEGFLEEASSGLSGRPPGVPTPQPTPGTPGAIYVRDIDVRGGFFGPQGREFAYMFSRSESTSSAPADQTFSFFGTVAGAR